MNGLEIGSLKQTKAATVLSLLTSSSTLACCALPALLVAVGAGAALSSLMSAVPQLVWLSVHKIEIFSAATAMLGLSGFLQWRARTLPCPTDPALAAVCTRSRRVSLWVYLVSVATFLIGVFFAFVAPLLMT
jgi:hypothetical protein